VPEAEEVIGPEGQIAYQISVRTLAIASALVAPTTFFLFTDDILKDL